jgi:hypothetical protein
VVHARGLGEACAVVEQAGLGEAEGQLRLLGRVGRDEEGGAVEEVLCTLAALVLMSARGVQVVANLEEEADDLEVDA